VTNKQYEK